ncbi:hypothetical protein [uncultured Acidaminococcus sp.]|uniref:hypothetical protein n=1 Tax=uncultured Acidaminococcus sp. TaxID=352152 RepID=UPI0026DBF8C8|nr:hypothetical protein [uncultured Acidaminococcus sp.]
MIKKLTESERMVMNTAADTLCLLGLDRLIIFGFYKDQTDPLVSIHAKADAGDCLQAAGILQGYAASRKPMSHEERICFAQALWTIASEAASLADLTEEEWWEGHQRLMDAQYKKS